MNISSENYVSPNQPFFMIDVLNEPLLCDKSENIDSIVFYEKLDQTNLPTIIRDLYIKIQSYNQEIYLNNWTFFSLDEIIKRNKILNENNIKAIDICLQYRGLGHINVIHYDYTNNTFYERYDGGSNGYDREINWENYKKRVGETKIDINTIFN
tara:strand:- start:283 stop:744 length:462 start_codon:yes stop_codon:yes gene_type:complete